MPPLDSQMMPGSSRSACASSGRCSASRPCRCTTTSRTRTTSCDGIVDIVESEIELPPPGADWKSALRTTALSAHDVFERHPWAASLTLSTTGSRPARWRYMNAILGCLREAGFSAETTDHAYHALESHIAGFTLWASQVEVDPGGPPATLRTPSSGSFPSTNCRTSSSTSTSTSRNGRSMTKARSCSGSI